MRTTKVHIRTKPIKNGRESLRLDYSPPITNPETGKQQRFEYLGLYVFTKPKTTLERQHNKDTKDLAQSIRAERQLMVQRGQFGFLQQKDKNINFIEYFDQVHKKRKRSIDGTWETTGRHLKEFFGPTLSMGNINVSVCEKFREYLLTAPMLYSKQEKGRTVSKNTASLYYSIFKTVLRQAFKDDLLTVDIAGKIEPISRQDTHRQYLTLEELQKAAKTDCAFPIVKRAAIFSALTGLRYSDIEKLTWGEIRQNETGHYLQFTQKKTKGAETVPIPEQARELLGEQGQPTEKIFNGLKYTNSLNLQIREWLFDAGINKKITFHCFRHTYATLQLSLGTDIYTVSKMLGHRDLKATQIYAKIVDEKKREAANKIKLDF